MGKLKTEKDLYAFEHRLAFPAINHHSFIVHTPTLKKKASLIIDLQNARSMSRLDKARPAHVIPCDPKATSEHTLQLLYHHWLCGALEGYTQYSYELPLPENLETKKTHTHIHTSSEN
ncbi:hypothetical protein EMCRGX_G008143 [Ephydatia muelleri]